MGIKMREQHFRDDGGFPEVLPKDAKMIKQFGSWRIFLAPKTEEVVFHAAVYHPGILYLNHEDLEELIKTLENGISEQS